MLCDLGHAHKVLSTGRILFRERENENRALHGMIECVVDWPCRAHLVLAARQRPPSRLIVRATAFLDEGSSRPADRAGNVDFSDPASLRAIGG